MRFHVGRPRFRSEINVTPLVDVVLVLLIVFLVVTPMLQRGQPVNLPEARQVSFLERGGDPIVLSITRDGRIWVDRREVRLTALTEALGAELARAPEAGVVVKGDRDLDYRTFREVIREVSRTRIPLVSLAATEPREGGRSP
jgi:biopolymer transport protein TolR